MNRDHILHFTIGPVQGFIEQARRTRDFWAGSFLLAWLSALAMNAARDRGATITFPKIEGDGDGDAMIAAVRNGAKQGPSIGTLPNRFKAEVPATFDPEAVKNEVVQAWTALANAVWRQYIQPVVNAGFGNGTEGIWQRQIGNFWEIAWVVDSPDGNDGAWLDRRKNWRSHRPPTEAGDHCTIMGDWQEISGSVQYRGGDKQKSFWEAVRQHVAKVTRSGLNLEKQERLCAIALVRRLFPLLGKNALRAVPLWETPLNWHSTGHMAAVSWIAEAVKKAPEACKTYFDYVDSHPDFGPRWSRAEQNRPVRCLEGAQAFGGIDANLFFRDNIINPRTFDADKKQPFQTDLQEAFGELGTALAMKRLAKEPRPYYALLRMDGDHVGRLLNRKDGQVAVRDALARFTGDVQRMVAERNGVVVYAGGDDLLALMPLDDAIAAAVALEVTYRNCFDSAFREGASPTISASIVYADHHEPLRAVLRDSQRLLEAAKDRNGRNSLAVSLLKPSGRAFEWVQAWRDPDARSIPRAVQQLAEHIQKNDEISARFGYTLDHRFLATLGSRFPELGLDRGELKSILQSSLGKRRDDDAVRAPDLDRIADELLLTGTPHRGDGAAPKGGAEFSVAGLRLAFFLAGRDGAEQREAAA